MSAPSACPGCAQRPEPADRFCENCGAELGASGRAAGPSAGATPGRCPACGVDDGPLPGDWCDTCGVRRPQDRVVDDQGPLAGVSDRGRVRSVNEDAIALGRGHAGTLAAVACDGVSTTRDAERAARVAADTALGVLLAPGPGGAGQVRSAVRAAARRVDAIDAGPSGPCCTLVGALVEPVDGSHDVAVTVGWVGDSRAYWLDGSAGGGRTLTTDHSWAADVVAAGVADAETALRDPRAHAITRWLGPDEDGVPGDGARALADVVAFRATLPGTLVLCTDGLWNHLPDPADLAAVLDAAASPLAAAQALTTAALAAGGHDNISVVVLSPGQAAGEGGTP